MMWRHYLREAGWGLLVLLVWWFVGCSDTPPPQENMTGGEVLEAPGTLSEHAPTPPLIHLTIKHDQSLLLYEEDCDRIHIFTGELVAITPLREPVDTCVIVLVDATLQHIEIRGKPGARLVCSLRALAGEDVPWC